MGSELAVLESAKTMREFLGTDNVQKQLAAALPKFLTIDRFIRVCYTAMLDNPKLLGCTRESIIGCMIRMGQLGLEPTLGKAWLIPYRNKEKPGAPLEAQFQTGWRGLAELAKRSGKVYKIPARTVFDGDIFDVEEGTVDRMIHKPQWKTEDPIFYYCVVFYTHQGWEPSFQIMTPNDVQKIRNASKAPNSPAWKTWFEQMAWKSVTKRLLKREDLSVEVNEAIQLDDMALMGKSQFVEEILTESPAITPAGSVSDAVKDFSEEGKTEVPEETVEPPHEVIVPDPPPTTPPGKDEVPFESPTAEEEAAAAEKKKLEEEEATRRALCKSFDSRVENEGLDPEKVNDALFALVAKRGLTSIIEAKCLLFESKAMDAFVRDLAPPLEPLIPPLGGEATASKLEDLMEMGSRESYAARIKGAKKTNWPNILEEITPFVLQGVFYKELEMEAGIKHKSLTKKGIYDKGEPWATLITEEDDSGVTETPPEADPGYHGFLTSMEGIRKKMVSKMGQELADEEYARILGLSGYESTSEITDREHQKEIYRMMGDLLID